MGEIDERSSTRRLKAAEEAARVLKPFGGEGAKKSHELLESLRKGGAGDLKTLKAVQAALLDALMSTKVKSKVTEKKSAFLHLLVAEKPTRPEIRAAYKEFEAAFARGAADASPV
jgi:hypothetical protein